jgi:two-component system, NarL family, response regulator LiaR
MDLLMPGMDGIAATKAIRSALPDTEVIALTSVLESAAVLGAVKAGAIGYLLKDTQAIELRKAIKAAAAGQVQISPQASAFLLRSVPAPETHEVLTEREMVVLRLLAQGKSNKEIAHHLQIVEDTVKTHIRPYFGEAWCTESYSSSLVRCTSRSNLVGQRTRTGNCIAQLHYGFNRSRTG